MDNGAYTYKAPASLGSDITETVGFTLSDNDGDTSASTLSINVAHDVLPPIVRNDHVFTNDDSSSTVVISDAALTHNDTDAGGHTIVVGTITNASSGDMATYSGSSTTFTDFLLSQWRFVRLYGVDGFCNRIPAMSLSPAPGDFTLTGTILDDILIGVSDNSNTTSTLNGDAGNDVSDCRRALRTGKRRRVKRRSWYRSLNRR